MADQVEQPEQVEPIEHREQGPRSTPEDVRIAELTREAAAFRVQRNVALRRAHAQDAILAAHNIDTSNLITDETTASLTIEDGRATGEFRYEVPRLADSIPLPSEGTDATASAAGPALLTREEIEAMSHDEINRRWDEVVTFMSYPAT